jgi:hypothetical protein
MTDATNAPAAAPAPDATLMGSAPAPAPVAATPAATPAAAPAATPAAAPAADAKPSEAPDGKPAADAKPDDKGASVAPEKYEDFKLPETLKADAPIMGKFAEWAKSHNLTQEAAQGAVDLAAEMQTGTAQQFQTAMEAQSTKWASESKADKEFGGDKFDENLGIAKTAMDKFGTPELKNLLEQSKLGNHPEVVRFFVRAGRAISQDGFVAGRAANNGARPSHEDVLYPTH